MLTTTLTFTMTVLAMAETSVPAAAPPVLTMAEALKEAEARNPDLAQARARLRQAKELSSRVWANYLPQVSIGASYTRNQYAASLSLPTGYWVRDLSGVPGFVPESANGPDYDQSKGPPSSPPDTSNPPGRPSNTVLFPSSVETLTLQKRDQFAVRGQVTQALIVPSLWPAFTIADLSERLVGVNVEQARREVLFAVVQLYYGCVSLKEIVAVQERLLENNVGHERDAKVQVESNMAPQIALLRAQLDRTSAEQELLNARASYAAAKVALAALLDRKSDFDVMSPPEPGVADNASALEEQAEQARPDVRAARLSREIADRTATSVRYSYAPSLVGTASYQAANLKGFTGSYDAWALGVGLSWTLWDGGLRESQRREATAKVLEADAALRAAMAKAHEEVRRAALDLEKARAVRTKAEEKVRLARENMRLINVAFKAGSATQVEVSDASTALAAAELSRVAETLNAQLAVISLAKAAGAFAQPSP